MSGITVEAEIIFETYLPDALQRALEYAGNDGFVASMPQLLRARASAPYDNEIWNGWFFTSNSEESVTRTPGGNRIVVVVHGGGIFGSPERFRRLYHANVDRFSADGFTGLFGAKILDREAYDIQEGKLPDGGRIPVFSYDEFERGIEVLPTHYAVVMDFDRARRSKSGYVPFDELREDPLMIARAGGIEAAAAYLDKAKGYYQTTAMGNWHPFNDIDPDQPQTYILFLFDSRASSKGEADPDPANRQRGNVDIWFTHYRISREAGFGLRGDTSMINMARYVAVAPRDVSTSLRDLDFG